MLEFIIEKFNIVLERKLCSMRVNSLFSDPYSAGLRPRSFMEKARENYNRKILMTPTIKSVNKSFKTKEDQP